MQACPRVADETNADRLALLTYQPALIARRVIRRCKGCGSEVWWDPKLSLPSERVICLNCLGVI